MNDNLLSKEKANILRKKKGGCLLLFLIFIIFSNLLTIYGIVFDYRYTIPEFSIWADYIVLALATGGIIFSILAINWLKTGIYGLIICDLIITGFTVSYNGDILYLFANAFHLIILILLVWPHWNLMKDT